MQFCVRSWNTGVGTSSSRKKPRTAVLRNSAICWSELIMEPLGWRSCRMRAFVRLILLTWTKNFFWGSVGEGFGECDGEIGVGLSVGRGEGLHLGEVADGPWLIKQTFLWLSRDLRGGCS